MARHICEHAPSRRHLLGTAAASLALWGLVPRLASAAGTRDPRLLLVILRGGLDGLAMLAPVGDPEYQRLRGALAIPADGASAGPRLDSLFALNRNMPFLADLIARREALGLHAIASPYRGRSHFDGQDVLESGLAGVGRIEDGWLNRALGGLPAAGSAAPRKGLAMGAVVPLVMRGSAPVLSWIPETSSLPLRASTIGRLNDLYAATDPKLAKAFAEGVAIGELGKAGPVLDIGRGRAATAAAKGQAAQARPMREFVDTAAAAARFLGAVDGPRIGALSFNGWDTHANEGVLDGQLAQRLAGLDLAIRTLHDGLGAAWRETVIAVVTEFGRTARANGTGGTDHGTGTAALLVGGAVKGGRISADWPGLAEAALFEGRDLKPTADLRAVLKGVLRDHLGVPAGALGARVFPGSERLAPLDGLIA
jgi:uncharacterized protein (DUF1501 family)